MLVVYICIGLVLYMYTPLELIGQVTTLGCIVDTCGSYEVRKYSNCGRYPSNTQGSKLYVSKVINYLQENILAINANQLTSDTAPTLHLQSIYKK